MHTIRYQSSKIAARSDTMLFASSPSLYSSQLFPFSLMKIKAYQKTKKKKKVLTHPNIIQTKEFSKTHTKKRKKKKKEKKRRTTPSF